MSLFSRCSKCQKDGGTKNPVLKYFENTVPMCLTCAFSDLHSKDPNLVPNQEVFRIGQATKFASLVGMTETQIVYLNQEKSSGMNIKFALDIATMMLESSKVQLVEACGWTLPAFYSHHSAVEPPSPC